MPLSVAVVFYCIFSVVSAVVSIAHWNDPYTSRQERQDYARATLLAPVWPVLVGVILVRYVKIFWKDAGIFKKANVK